MFLSILKDTPFLLPATEKGREEMHNCLLRTAPRLEYFTAGHSIAGREIVCYKIGKGRGRVAIFGAHHALESITANILYTFIYILHSPYYRLITRENSLSHFLSLYTYYAVPCLNPDGVELRFAGDTTSPMRSRILTMSGGDLSRWQANERGVDLNHNYDAGFSEYKCIEAERGITAGATLYSGEYPESEPESRCAGNLVRFLSPMAVVSLHSQGEEIFFSPSCAKPLVRRFATLTGYRLSLTTGTAAYGGLCDYTGGVLGIPSLTVEVGRGRNPLPETDVTQILARIAHALFRLPSLI